MKKTPFFIDDAKFAKLHAAVKSFEAKNGSIKIGKLSLSSFLLANTSVSNDRNDSKPVRTKRRVLHIAGDFTTDPSTLSGTIKLKANLHYGNDEFALLQIQLNKLVKEYLSSASVSKTEADKCETVADCVKLVNAKTAITA